MFFSESDVTEFIEDNDVKFIRLTFCDTLGAMKNIAILPRELRERLLTASRSMQRDCWRNSTRTYC